MKNLSVRALCGVAVLAGISALSACSGRNIHRDLQADPAVLTRGWTMQTRQGVAEAGDRGFDYSTPVQYENTIIFGSRSAGLVSIYPGLGRVRWKLTIPGGVLSEPAIHRNTILVGGADGFFYCVSAETGKVVWKYEEKNTLVSRPTVSNGRVFFTTSDDTVYALDAGTGKWLWHYKRRSSTTAKILGASSPLVDNNEAIVGMSDGFLVALSVDDGTLKWERKLHQGSKFNDIDASPVLQGDLVYVPSYDGSLYALRKGGDIVWRYDAGGSRRVVIDEARIYLPSSQGAVIALDKNTAKELWQFELDRGVPTSIVSAGRYLIFASSHQYLYVVERESGKGVYRWNAGDGSGFSGSPILDAEGKHLYLLSMAGNLYQFNLRHEPKARELYQFSSNVFVPRSFKQSRTSR